MNTTSPRRDHAADAARLLRRIGFAVLVIALPLAAIVSRRGAVILGPIGAALLLIALVLDPESPSLPRRLAGAFTSPLVLVAAYLVGWATLSLAWTPFPTSAGARLAGIVGTAVLGAAMVWTLPDRMRASTLNLIPVGAFLAAMVAAALGVAPRVVGLPDWLRFDRTLVERGLAALSLLALVGMGWLVSRGRGIAAIALIVVVASAAAAQRSLPPLAAFVAGAAVFLLARASRPAMRWLVGGVTAGSLIVAPALPFLVAPLASLGGPFARAAARAQPVAAIELAEPLKLITGRGYDAVLAAVGAGILTGPPHLPHFEIWYELGLPGAFAAALCLWLAASRAGREEAGVAAAGLGLIAAAFVQTCLGAGLSQVWWIATISVAVVALRAIARGQFRTTRPRATLRGANA